MRDFQIEFQHISTHSEELLIAEFILEPHYSILNLYQATNYPSEIIYSSATDKLSTPWHDCLKNMSQVLIS